ncbi:MAG: hypothetical protein JXR25_06580 [Pontiellaceae bacterium]|nr:hypothetical protein [Pontiellaceae bacterium]MBN2784475.1 hypothetical protein [Pontiellaceae bacterium]
MLPPCSSASHQAERGRLKLGGETEWFFDDTQIEVNGKKFEGASINYNGDLALSWQTLWIGPFMCDAVLGTPADHKFAPESCAHGRDVSVWMPEMLERCAPLGKRVRMLLHQCCSFPLKSDDMSGSSRPSVLSGAGGSNGGKGFYGSCPSLPSARNRIARMNRQNQPRSGPEASASGTTCPEMIKSVKNACITLHITASKAYKSA